MFKFLPEQSEKVQDCIKRYKAILSGKKSSSGYRSAFTKKLKKLNPKEAGEFLQLARALNTKGTRSEEQNAQIEYQKLVHVFERFDIEYVMPSSYCVEA